MIVELFLKQNARSHGHLKSFQVIPIYHTTVFLSNFQKSPGFVPGDFL